MSSNVTGRGDGTSPRPVPHPTEPIGDPTQVIPDTDQGIGSSPSLVDGTGSLEVVRHEEELLIHRRDVEVGRLRIHKVIHEQPIDEDVYREVEHAQVVRVPADPDDNGRTYTLDDGSLSIPVLAEEIVVHKRTIVKERVIVRKERRVETEHVSDVLRQERIEIEVPAELRDRLDVAPQSPSPPHEER
jgi:uncharacterized protein (TIGR02271 family)